MILRSVIFCILCGHSETTKNADEYRKQGLYFPTGHHNCCLHIIPFAFKTTNIPMTLKYIYLIFIYMCVGAGTFHKYKKREQHYIIFYTCGQQFINSLAENHLFKSRYSSTTTVFIDMTRMETEVYCIILHSNKKYLNFVDFFDILSRVTCFIVSFKVYQT